jgi:hypothetical protein
MNSLFTPLSATAPISSKPESDVPAEFESKGSCRGSMCVVAARPADLQDEVPSNSESSGSCRGTFCVVA